MENFENTGYRMCCEDDLINRSIFTSGNLAIIGASSRYEEQSFLIWYRIRGGCVSTTPKSTATGSVRFV